MHHLKSIYPFERESDGIKTKSRASEGGGGKKKIDTKKKVRKERPPREALLLPDEYVPPCQVVVLRKPCV